MIASQMILGISMPSSSRGVYIMCWDFKSITSDRKKLAVVCGVSLAISVVSFGIAANELCKASRVGTIDIARILTESSRLKAISDENRQAVDKVYKEAMAKEKELKEEEKGEFRKKTMVELRSYKQKNSKEHNDAIKAAADKVAKAKNVGFVMSDRVIYTSNTVDLTEEVLKEIDAAK